MIHSQNPADALVKQDSPALRHHKLRYLCQSYYQRTPGPNNYASQPFQQQYETMQILDYTTSQASCSMSMAPSSLIRLCDPPSALVSTETSYTTSLSALATFPRDGTILDSQKIHTGDQNYAPWDSARLFNGHANFNDAPGLALNPEITDPQDYLSQPSPSMTDDASGCSDSASSISSPIESPAWLDSSLLSFQDYQGNTSQTATQGPPHYALEGMMGSVNHLQSNNTRDYQSSVYRNSFPLPQSIDRLDSAVPPILPQGDHLARNQQHYAPTELSFRPQTASHPLGIFATVGDMAWGTDPPLEMANSGQHKILPSMASMVTWVSPYMPVSAVGEDSFQDNLRTFVPGDIPSFDGQGRSTSDALLLKLKRHGWPYRKIKEFLGLQEAESTLRGRYRTMTKAKHERVRAPEWQDVDVLLLMQGVERLRDKSDREKIPWKKVTEFMVERGGSYKFGAATCKKKWVTLQSDNASREDIKDRASVAEPGLRENRLPGR